MLHESLEIGHVRPPVADNWRSPQSQTPGFLDPGERISVTQAGAAEWRKDQGRLRHGRPLFYLSGWHVVTASPGFPSQLPQDRVEVCVPDPKDDDQTIYHLLLDDPFLADAMMSAVRIPDLDVWDALEDIVRRYPQSSYADYARFALARGRLNGLHVALERCVWQTEQEFTAGMESKLTNAQSTDEMVRDLLRSDYFPGCHLRGTLAKLLDQAVAARHGSHAERQAALAGLVRYSFVSAEDHAAAVQLLGQITNRDFAYRPNALILECIVHHVNKLAEMKAGNPRLNAYSLAKYQVLCRLDDPPRVKEITNELNGHYRDSSEWIEYMSGLLHKPDEWRAFRIEKAATANPPPVCP